MPTIASIKQQCIDRIAPGNDVEFLRLLQEADMRLLEFGKFRWSRARVTLTIVDGYIHLPAEYASILGAHIAGHPTDIHEEHYEFTPGGPGEIDVEGGASLRLIDQGIDDNTGLRYYKVAGQPQEGAAIVALCHKAPKMLWDSDLEGLCDEIPEGSSDTTVCPDAAALKLMMFGIIFEEANDMGASSQYVAAALRGLENKEKTARGGARQMVNLRPNGPGIRRISSFR